MSETLAEATGSSRAAGRTIHFPQPDGSCVPYAVFSAQEVYDCEQERIYRGPHWSFVALACEIPNLNDFKSTFVGDTPVVVTRPPYGWRRAAAQVLATVGASAFTAVRWRSR